MSFSLDLAAFATKTNLKADAIVRDVVLAVDESLVEKSPVGNPELWANPGVAPKGYVGGRFRANWQYGENEVPEGELYTPIYGPFPDAAESVSRETSKVNPQAGGKIHYLANNLPYAQALEDGHSAKQAPAGVVGITVIEFEGIVKEMALKANL
jgi:hypothetical protein